MSKNIMAALLLIVAGLFAFNSQSVSYKTRVKTIEAGTGTVQVTAEKTKAIPIPRLAGIIAISGGLFLLFMNKPLKP